ncbi:MAG TPA: hypothetical protein VLI04_10000 [Nocardioidaceae bacterium]|nr:hypothetical protein [Nocardioidaceae bacterium]
MDEYEELFRESLERHAQEVDTAVAVPTARKRSSWQVPLAAAAAVGVVAAASVALLRDDTPAPIEVPPITTIPADWRVEQWQGIQVSVPPEWGWGGAPMVDEYGGRESGRLLDCGAGAFVHANATAEENAPIPYVGRPTYMTDVCHTYDPAHPPTPTAPYVWLGAPIDEGTRELGGGWTQQTIVVDGAGVTVATQDATLRAQILASAEAAPVADDACEAELSAPPQPMVGREGVSGERLGMTVCAYERDGETARLVYATKVDAAAADRFLGPPYGQDSVDCADPADEWVVLLIPYLDAFGGNTRVVARVVLSFGACSYVEFHSGIRGPLLEGKVAPWAVDGIRAYVTGPRDYTSELAQYFRGMLG